MPSKSIDFDSRSLPDRIVDLLVDEIGAEKISEGTLIVERDIAKYLHVSRVPVREAIKTLEADGVLVSEPRCSSQIIKFDHDWALELHTTRLAVEKHAVSKAAISYRQHPDRICHLDVLLDKMATQASLGDRLALNNLDLDFHQRLYHEGSNPLLTSIWRCIRRHLRISFAKERVSKADISHVVHQHRRLRDMLLTASDAELMAEVQDHIGGPLSLYARTADMEAE